MAKLVVATAFFIVAQYIVSFGSFFKLFFGLLVAGVTVGGYCKAFLR
jgi:hypothetical protein